MTTDQLLFCGGEGATSCSTGASKVCADHAIEVVIAHSHDAVHAAASLIRTNQKRRNFVRHMTRVFDEYESLQDLKKEPPSFCVMQWEV